MVRKLLLSAVALTATVASGAALADWAGSHDGDGFYVLAEAGGSKDLNLNINGIAPVAALSTETQSSHLTLGTTSSSSWNGALGYKYGFTRIDFTYGRLNNDAELMRTNNTSPGAETDTGVQGELKAKNWFLNLYADGDLGYGLRPFVGIGAGRAKISSTAQSDSTTVNAIDGQQSLSAYTVHAGLAYDFTPAIAVHIDYHFMGTERKLIQFAQAATYLDGKLTYHNNSVNAGVSYTFNF